MLAGGLLGTGGLSIKSTNIHAADGLHVTGGMTIGIVQHDSTDVTVKGGDFVVGGSGEERIYIHPCIYIYL